MRLSSTSTQRTYRYLRIAIVCAAAVLAIGLVVVLVTDGPVTSISAMFYTSGRTIFVGAICAIALGLVALSGHSVEQVLLDVAAVIAIVPTPIGVGDVAVPTPIGVGDVAVPTPIGVGDLSGLLPSCAAAAGVCVPPGELPGVQTGVIVLAITAVAGAILALIVARVQHTLTAGVLIGAGAATAVGVGLAGWLLAAPASLLAAGHLVATAAFFGLMVAVAVISALTARRPWQRMYALVATGMVVFLVYLFVVEIARLDGADLTGQPWVLAGEAGLVALFAVFWIAQTAQKWDEADPSIVRER